MREADNLPTGVKQFFTGKQRLAKPGMRNVSGPARMGATGATVYGLLRSNSGGNAPAITEMFADGSMNTIFNLPKKDPQNYTLGPWGMYVRDGRVYVLAEGIYYGIFVMQNEVLEYNMDGTLVKQTIYDRSNDVPFTTLCYNPKDDTVYGYVLESESGKLYYCTAPGATPNKLTPLTVVKDGASVCAMTYNVVDDKIIGITTEGKVLEISAIDGSQTEVATLDYPSSSVTSLCYSPMDSGYYYAEYTDSAWSIQLLNENTFEVVSKADYDHKMMFAQFYCIDNRKIDLGAPGLPTLVNTIFGNGALSGSLTYRLASDTYGGTPILGDIDWVLYVDGKEAKRGSGAAGSNVVVTLENLEEGLHDFSFHTSLGGKEGRYCDTSFYVGNDTPVATASVTLDTENIKWEPVTEGVHAGYVNAAEVTYNVYLNGEAIATGIKETECPAGMPQGEVMEAYVATVEAEFAGKVSEPTNSNDVAYGEPYPLPLQLEPTAKESKIFTIVDANEDGNTIYFTQANFVTTEGDGYKDQPMFCYNYSGYNDADDWLFLPITRFGDANGVYEFSMNAFRVDNYTESFEVKLCTEANPESVVKTLIENTELPGGAFEESFENIKAAFDQRFKAEFIIPSAGNYYVGVHVTSPADQFKIYMRDFSIRKLDGMTPACPNPATELQADAATGGALNATVTFTFPTASMNGIPYEADKTLEATVKAAGCAATTASGKPGETVTVSVITKQGDNEISVVINDGEMASVPATIGIYTGVERPGTVENLKAVVDPTDYVAHITWDVPSVGVNGGYVAPTGITYFLCLYEYNILGQGYWVIDREIGTDVFEYDYKLPEDTPQDLVRLGIVTANFAGDADYLTSTSAVMGKPYVTPVLFNCKAKEVPDPTISYGSGFGMAIGDPAYWYGDAFATEENLNAIYTYPQEEGEGNIPTLFSLPKFSTKDLNNPALKLEIYGGSTSSFSVLANAYGIEDKVIKTFNASDFTTRGPQTVVIDLGEEFRGKDWVEVRISANTSETESFILYSLKYFDDVDYDFGVTSIEGPQTAMIGTDNRYVAHITNFGNVANTLTSSTWDLTDSEGNVIAHVSLPAGTEPVAPGDETTVDITFTPNADQNGICTITFAIDKDDVKEVNDTLTREIQVDKGHATVITDLVAKEVGYDNVVLGWTPVKPFNNYIEGLEDETPMIFDDESDMVAGFKRVDADGKTVYGPAAEEYEALPTAFKPQSYVVWSAAEINEMLGYNLSVSPYTAYDGDKFLIAFCPSDLEDPEDPDSKIVAADDWLISPAVAGGTDFSFFIRPITYQYGAEVVEIMYSTTGDNVEDFKLLETLEIKGEAETPTIWEDYTFTLPEDAKYVAIHYVSRDVFGIMLDNIAYVPEGKDVKLTGYDIYRDGTVIAANAPCADGTYTDATVEENAPYTYMVMPVLENGTKGLESNTVTIRTSGIGGITSGCKAIFAGEGEIVVNGYEGEAVAIVSADGKLITTTADASASERFAVSGGIYVVKAGKDVVKLILK